MYYDLAKEKMVAALNSLSNELAKVRTGRASTSVLDNVSIEYYGAMTRLVKR